MKSVVEYNTHYMEMEPQSTVVLSDSQLSKWLIKNKNAHAGVHMICYYVTYSIFFPCQFKL